MRALPPSGTRSRAASRAHSRAVSRAAGRAPGRAALRRGLAALGAAAAATAVAGLVAVAWGIQRAIGARPAALRRTAADSPHARDGVYRNTEPPTPIPPGTVGATLRAARRRAHGRPSRPVPLAASGAGPGPAADLAVTWFGHSAVLLEIDGRRVLADPVWGERASPSRLVGPRRLHPAPVALADLPPVAAILISHDHYDHLDLPTVRALAADPRHGAAPFVVPLGIGAHLRAWGVPEGRIVELDWGGTAEVAGLRLTCAEARHFAGRGLRRDGTLWSSWAVAGPGHRAYFGGDTGYTAAFARAGAELGPFDLTMLPIGAYSDLWPDIHMNPEECVAAHRDLRGGILLPVHWATFNLAFHPWSEPVNRLRRAAESAGIALALPVPGHRIELGNAPGTPPPVDDWWSPVA